MTRTPSSVDAIADSYLAQSAAADPIFATGAGISDHDDALTDFSPAGIDERAGLLRDLLSQLSTADPIDDVDRVTIATMSSHARRELAVSDAGLRAGEVNVIESALQGIRDIFDLMGTATADERDVMRARIHAIPGSLESSMQAITARLDHGPMIARRQVELVAAQADTAAQALDDNIARALADAPGDADSFAAAREVAAAGYAVFAEFLRTRVAGRASAEDAVGREAYALHSAAFVGTDIDPDEAYAWGLDRLNSIVTEQEALAARIAPGESIAGAFAALDANPRYQMTDRDAFVAWMQDLSDRATAALAGTHFDIPAELTALECKLAPSATGIIYYTAPSQDMSRPGRMWWSVPESQQVFHTWQETTTVFHEGVPGHHLQIGQAMVSPELNQWRKLASFTSGHGEGWALYAERLMADLGWLDDDGDRMGMLDSQRLRAARVVVDIGLHCGLAAPDSVGGGVWDAAKAWEFLTQQVAMDRTVLRFEWSRYLGWPGQAPSYALGQRVWEQARDACTAANPGVGLKDFHSRALRLGGVSLDVLTDELITGS